VELLQEHLVLRGAMPASGVDGIFGDGTENALWSVSGAHEVDALTAELLDAPIARAMSATGSIVDVARTWLLLGCREVGRNNGPWLVALAGVEAEARGDAWCAWILRCWATQAGLAWASEISPSCDITGARARAAGRMLAAPEPGCAFLVRGSARDPSGHTGLVTRVTGDRVETIEGNTNATGEREGYQVCARTRRTAGLDFVRLT
jgi:hypothetical protein